MRFLSVKSHDHVPISHSLAWSVMAACSKGLEQRVEHLSELPVSTCVHGPFRQTLNTNTHISILFVSKTHRTHLLHFVSLFQLKAFKYNLKIFLFIQKREQHVVLDGHYFIISTVSTSPTLWLLHYFTFACRLCLKPPRWIMTLILSPWTTDYVNITIAMACILSHTVYLPLTSPSGFFVLFVRVHVTGFVISTCAA